MNEFIDSTHQYLVDGKEVPGVTTILKAAGLYNEDYFTEEARARGSYVHTACLYYLQGDLDEESVKEEYRGYILAFKLFMSESECKPLIEQCEVPLFSHIFRYAGTPDIPCMFKGRKSLIDIKTAAETPTTGVQLAGYVQLMDTAADRYGLHLKADGKYRLKPYVDRKDIQIFNAALSLYFWRQKEGLL